MPKLFCLFFILSIPIIALYRNNSVIDYELDVDTNFGKFSLANLGMNKKQCSMVPFSIGYDHITCAYGTIGKMKNGFFGVNKFE